MCGIMLAASSAPIDCNRFELAREALAHRGPDAADSRFLDGGRIALGHRRLSIIDLSARANQPMQSAACWIVYNGEIYNYRELRRELERLGCVFRTESDTEVLLHGYRVWGDTLCGRLIGMFAFAIWDADRRELFLARDHFGQKPLYFTHTGREFVAASEIKAIRAYLGTPLRLRREAVLDAMVQDFVAEPHTWYQDIQCLPSAHQMRVRCPVSGPVAGVPTTYWPFVPDPNPPPVGREEALERLGHELELAVRSHLIADVEVGGFLSGGSDSTCVVSLASGMTDRPMQTFSIGFDGASDELAIAGRTAERLGTTHRSATITEADFQSSIDQALAIFDHPFSDTSLVPTHRVSAMAAEHVKVVLTGDGGDECLGGYNYGRYLSPQVDNRARNLHGSARARAAASALLARCRRLVLSPQAWSADARSRLVSRKRLNSSEAKALHPALLHELEGYDPAWPYRLHSRPELDPFRAAQWIGIKVPLPNKMLIKVDRCSMAHSLETRAPLLSPRLVELILSLPREVTNPDDDTFKGLFRAWLRGRIRDEVLDAPKRGFGVPRRWQPLRDTRRIGRELLPLASEAGIVRPGGWKELRSGKQMWRFVQLERALETGLTTV